MLISFVFFLTNTPYVIFWSWYDSLDKNLIVPIDLRRILKLGDLTTATLNLNYACNALIYAAKYKFFIPTLKSIFSSSKDENKAIRYSILQKSTLCTYKKMLVHFLQFSGHDSFAKIII